MTLPPATCASTDSLAAAAHAMAVADIGSIVGRTAARWPAS